MDLHVEDASEFVSILNDAVWMQKNIVVACNFRQRSTGMKYRRPPESFVDIWINAGEIVSGASFRPTEAFSFADTTSLMLQLGHILSQNQRFCRHSRLRIFAVVPVDLAPEPASEYCAVVRDALTAQLKNARIFTHTSAAVRVLIVNTSVRKENNNGENKDNADDVDCVGNAETLNNVMREHSSEACLVLLGLPPLPGISPGKTTSDGAESTEVSAEDAIEWCHIVRITTQNLPPSACVQYGQKQRCITSDI
jgi:hypothetical protein